MESTATSTVRQFSASSVMAAKSKLRYPLRSALKVKEEKKDNEMSSTSPLTKRGRNTPSTITKSMSVLHLSDSKLSSRTPGRFSVPMNSTSSQPRVLTETTKFTGRRRFSTLSSVSYWLSQIKLSETASKHKISLGFFKLALESECEPLQRIREELKSYAVKHNIVAEFGEPARELFKSYDILEDLEGLQDKEQPSVEKKSTSLSAARTGSLKPRTLHSETSKLNEANKIEGARKFLSTAKTRASSKRSMADLGTQKNVKTKKLGFKRGIESVGKPKGKFVAERDETDSGDVVNPTVPEHIPEENKENVDNKSEEEIRPNEEPKTN